MFNLDDYTLSGAPVETANNPATNQGGGGFGDFLDGILSTADKVGTTYFNLDKIFNPDDVLFETQYPQQPNMVPGGAIGTIPNTTVTTPQNGFAIDNKTLLMGAAALLVAVMVLK